VTAHAGGVLVGHAHQRLSEGLRHWLRASFDSVYMVGDRGSLVEGARRLQPALMVVDLALVATSACRGFCRQRIPQAGVLRRPVPVWLLSGHCDGRVALRLAMMAARGSDREIGEIGVRLQLIDFFLARLRREMVIVCYGC